MRAGEKNAQPASAHGARALACTRRQALGVAALAVGSLVLGSPRAAWAAGDEEGETRTGEADGGGTLFAALRRDDTGKALWGFVDGTGAWVIEPRFSDVASKPGRLKEAGAGVSPLEPDYDCLYTECMGLTPGVFDGKLAAARDDGSGQWGYVDRTGSWVINAIYDLAGTFTPDGFAVVLLDEEIHYIREDGSDAFGALVPASATPFCGGLASVQDARGDNLWACINTDGDWALESAKDTAHPYVYDAPLCFSEGVGLTRGSDGLVYVDADGAAQLDFPTHPFDRYGTSDCVFHQGHMFYMGFFYDKEGTPIKESVRIERNVELGGVVKGTVEAPPFEREGNPYFASNGFAGVNDYDLTLAGYIDEKGEWVIRPQFLRAEPFGEGLAAVQEWATRDYGFIDESGEWVITPRFSSVGWPFRGGLVYADVSDDSSERHSGWIDRTGSWVCDWGSDAENDEDDGKDDGND